MADVNGFPDGGHRDALSLEMTEELLEENVRLGYIEHGPRDENGNWTYRMTPEGQRRVEEMMAGTDWEQWMKERGAK